mmetsp:Transcript_6405/g.10957  ORF Transcript_6405/g.10957 Transcript_6405/m.10957 type:complete len:90 (+) Transcript_6405:750-1019(+)
MRGISSRHSGDIHTEEACQEPQRQEDRCDHGQQVAIAAKRMGALCVDVILQGGQAIAGSVEFFDDPTGAVGGFTQQGQFLRRDDPAVKS